MENHDFKIIVGLGNPGRCYAGTYHNIGEEALRRITGDNRFKRTFSVFKNKPFEYLQEENTVYVRPLTFMNESGKAVQAAMKYFSVKPEDILVIHDDSDIEVGSYKLSFGRGSAGHNGVKSIIKYLGTEDFWRLRIGVRGIHKESAGDFVLQKISPEDREKLDKALSEIKIGYLK